MYCNRVALCKLEIMGYKYTSTSGACIVYSSWNAIKIAIQVTTITAEFADVGGDLGGHTGD